MHLWVVKKIKTLEKIKDEITKFGEVLPAEESRKRSRQKEF